MNIHVMHRVLCCSTDKLAVLTCVKLCSEVAVVCGTLHKLRWDLFHLQFVVKRLSLLSSANFLTNYCQISVCFPF